jgi:Flp pilus assembly pilin Flp
MPQTESRHNVNVGLILLVIAGALVASARTLRHRAGGQPRAWTSVNEATSGAAQPSRANDPGSVAPLLKVLAWAVIAAGVVFAAYMLRVYFMFRDID